MTEIQWEAFRRGDATADAWIVELQRDSDVHGTLRLVFGWLLGPVAKSNLRSDNIREGDLPKPIPALRVIR